MSTKKAILITCVILVAGAGVAYAFRNKKAIKGKKATLDVGPVEIGQVDNTLRQGSEDEQHVTQLQEVLNVLHKAAKYINTNCGGIKWGYMAGSNTDGSIVKENGVFDVKTANASQYYLNRREVELEYLDLIRKKVAKYKTGDKCVYPMAIPV